MAETVADVLEDIDDPVARGTEDMLLYLEGRDIDMSYEDWVRPLKLTGGRVCLEVDHPATTQQVYWTVKWDTLNVAWSDGQQASGPGLVPYLEKDVRDIPSQIQPVLREDTPFGEDDND